MCKLHQLCLVLVACTALSGPSLVNGASDARQNDPEKRFFFASSMTAAGPKSPQVVRMDPDYFAVELTLSSETGIDKKNIGDYINALVAKCNSIPDYPCILESKEDGRQIRSSKDVSLGDPPRDYSAYCIQRLDDRRVDEAFDKLVKETLSTIRPRGMKLTIASKPVLVVADADKAPRDRLLEQITRDISKISEMLPNARVDIEGLDSAIKVSQASSDEVYIYLDYKIRFVVGPK